MGKKSAQKKNRQKNYHQPGSVSAREAVVNRKELSIASLSGHPEDAKETSADNAKLLNFGEQTDFIRRDILRISLLLLIVAIVLSGLVITNKKTDLLQRSGKELASFLRLQ